MGTTGVINAYNVQSWIFEGEALDPEYEAALEEARKAAYNEAIDEGLGEDEAEEAAEVAQEDFSDFPWEAPYLLYGDWKHDPVTGKYEEDTAGKNGYAAIYRSDSNVFQVVWSRWAMSAHQCSPCYPFQGDLDTPGDTYTAYAFPKDLMDERWLQENGNRYIELEASHV